MKKFVIALLAVGALAGCGSAVGGTGTPDYIRTYDVNTHHGRVTCVENTRTGSLSCR